MEWVEVTGKTVEEAKDAALDQLGVDEADAEFEVIETPKGGLFGRLRSEARVRARVLPTSPPPKIDRRERRRQGQRTRSPARESERRASPPRPAGAASTPKKGAEMTTESPEVDGTEVAETFVRGLLAAFGSDYQLERRELDEGLVEIAVEGDGLGLLIGPKGATLSAVQELARTVVQRKAPSHHGRFVLDVGGYRRARREALERFTRQVAEQVLESGVPRVLEPMPPADRKVIHDTVNLIDGVVTSSEGEEPRRRVMIGPDKADS